MTGVDAFISLGSNLGDRLAHLAGAVAALAHLPETELVAVSQLYETDPVGPPPQGPYLNAAVHLRTGMTPRALLDGLLEIERATGRARGARWAARTLDLDLLLYGDQHIDEPGLQVPHPRLSERAFVLEPLAELAAERLHPQLGTRIGGLRDRVRNPAAVRPGDPVAYPWPPAGRCQ